MINDLPAFAADIKDQFIAAEIHVARNALCRVDHILNHGRVIFLKMRDGDHVLLGNHQDMDRRFGMNVFERPNSIVRIDGLGRYAPVCNFTKNAIWHNNYEGTNQYEITNEYWCDSYVRAYSYIRSGYFFNFFFKNSINFSCGIVS